MEATFWRLAHQHYQGRKPQLLTEVTVFTWFAFFALVYGAALFSGWTPSLLEAFVGVLLLGGPLCYGLMHRRIRIEASKAPDALYRKRVATNP